MVSQERSKDDTAASAQPPHIQHTNRQQPSQTPWSDEPNEDIWDHVGVERNSVGMPVLPPSSHPVANTPAPGNSQTDQDDGDENVWDEARRQQPSQAKQIVQGRFQIYSDPGVPQPPEAMPTEAFSKLSVNDASKMPIPGSRVVDSQKDSHGHPIPQPRPVTADGIESDPWASNDDKPSVSQPNMPPKSPALISLKSDDDDDGPAWKDELVNNGDKIVIESPPSAVADELLHQNVWDDLAKEDESADERPPLPARSTGLQQKWVPSRPPVDAKAETYQVKKIRWHDTKSQQNPRTSPILIQNENGPCPLVALVNALTLTTPADNPDTTLVQVLRSREQISLNLLLDAVFDELMSPRRTNSEDALPDVSDLYAFLQSLHTGMNVNPRFVPTPEMVDAYKRTSLTHLHPTERGNLIPGTFENTMEMSLYAAFSIPLIHGWLPSQTDPAYSALERQAGSYEDVQNLLFREEELEEKLSSPDGLTEDEQQLYQDIMTIKMFLSTSATQLTAWGIEVIGKAMRRAHSPFFFETITSAPCIVTRKRCSCSVL
ncbi:hypothetical protein J3459_018629 [Metarhizium acridum]|nr:hypothetical protein J3459_018629 [Metarhizium acridum]